MTWDEYTICKLFNVHKILQNSSTTVLHTPGPCKRAVSICLPPSTVAGL